MATHRLSILCALAASAAWVASATGQQITRISERPDGAAAQGASTSSCLSLDGRFVAFSSTAEDLVFGDTNGRRDVFVHDRRHGSTGRVSVHDSGAQATADCELPALSGDGRYVTFTSRASNLVDGDTNGVADIFFHDRLLHETTRVSLSSGGAQGNHDCGESSISANGYVIVFVSDASNLVAGDTNGSRDAFVHFRTTGETRRISVSSTGVQANSYTNSVRVSANGRSVVFASFASNLIDGISTAAQQTYLHDLATRETTLVSVAPDGSPGDQRSAIGSPSSDARFIAFESSATNLIPNDTNPEWDVYVRDRLAGTTEKVSVHSSGAQVLGRSHRPAIDPDGRFVLFRSLATGLADGSGPYPDVFLHDRSSRETVIVSRGIGSAASNGESHAGGVSADGRAIAFSSAASNLLPGDTNGFEDVFVRSAALPDRGPRHTTLASISSEGFAGSESSEAPALSSDGRFVAFHSSAPELVFDDTNTVADVFVHDRSTGTTTRSSVAGNGAQANGRSERPELSADGRFVVFQSEATNLDPWILDGNTEFDVFLHDQATGSTECISIDLDGIAGIGSSTQASVSGDGRFVAFQSNQTRMVPGDYNGFEDVFVRDRQSGTMELVSRSTTGGTGDLPSTAARISPDGRFVVFRSRATNLVPGDLNHREDVFVRDRWTGTTSRVSVDSLGTEGNGRSSEADISDDGRFVVFESDASNLVPGDWNGTWDVFVHDRVMGSTVRVSVDSNGLEGDGISHRPRISPEGRYVTFRSAAQNLVPGDTNHVPDLYLHDLVTRRTTRVSVATDGSQSDLASEAGPLSNDATVIAFPSAANHLVVYDSERTLDIFVHVRCDVVFEPFGLGLAGSAGLIPHLSGAAGSHDDYRLRLWNGLGAAPGVLVASPAEAAWPLLGGTLYFDVLQPYVSLPFVLAGSLPTPGVGAFDLSIPGVGGLSGQTWILQAVVLDASAPQGATLTNGLRMRVND